MKFFNYSMKFFVVLMALVLLVGCIEISVSSPNKAKTDTPKVDTKQKQESQSQPQQSTEADSEAEVGLYDDGGPPPLPE